MSGVGPVQLGTRGLLDGLTAFGPYFAVGTHRPTAAAAPPWVPLSALLGSPAALGERAAAVRAALAGDRPPGAVGFRVAASVAQLGVAARLLSPAIAAAAAYGLVLELDPAAVWWQPVLGGPFPLSLPDDAIQAATGEGGGGPGVAGDPGHAAGLVRDSLLDGPVRRLVELTAGMSVSRAVLWGNVASAINGATAMIASSRAGLAGPAREAGAALLQYGPLAGAYTGTLAGAYTGTLAGAYTGTLAGAYTGTLAGAYTGTLAGAYTGTLGGGFRRRSCCLIYRASPGPRGAVCGDCVLGRP